MPAKIVTPGETNALRISAAINDHAGLIGAIMGATEVTVNHVQFPSTQVPSADPNALDDYEEGTWTPAMEFVTPGDFAATYNTQIGSYTKIGRLVTIDFNIITSSFTHTTAAGNLRINGLPFAAASQIFGGNFSWSGITKAGYTQIAFQVTTLSVMVFNASGSGLAQSNVTAADTPTGGTMVLRGLATYRV